MIIVRLKSGMGNQMFQYALGQRLAKELNTQVKYDLSALLDRSRGPDFVYRNYDLDIFNLKLEFTHSPNLLKVLSKLKSSSVTKYFREQVKKGRTYIKEEGFHFQEDLIAHPLNDAVYEGWFQSYKYLEGIERDISRDFAFKNDIINESLALYDEIRSCNAVCLNVRRTDFVFNDNLNVTSLSYFEKGAKMIAERVADPQFYIFSDDVRWCKQNIKLPFPMQVVDHKHKGYKFGNYLQLISSCKHFIIPNSSFAWWGAWLSTNEEKTVITPTNWFNDKTIDTSDLVPADWIRI